MTWKRGHKINQLDEEHHRIYGSKWALGLDQIEFLISQGLEPHHKVLDFGCGAGRLGIHLIKYLYKGNYTGFDGHLPSINAFINYELILNQLTEKEPVINCIDIKKNDLGYNGIFDFVMAFSVFNHLDSHEKAIKNVSNSLKNNGTFVSAFSIPNNHQSHFLKHERSEQLHSKLVKDKIIKWSIYKKCKIS